ncbi:helix-turn-helix domain-containing protein [Pseudoxanthomonas sp. F11]|uniref:helix-turn-helix domain-containing protein n=1 Tax=Pseudoxanthomonas sp. F11 TaxID=3126308 RepID=UPI0031F30127
MPLQVNFKSSGGTMDIGEVAKRSGVPASALRYYEQRGLIASDGRRGLRRTFDPRVLERLALIALGQTAGFSLDEIAAMFGADGQPDIDRRALRTKARELDAMILRLTAMRDGLRHAAACSAPSHFECPRFRALLGQAIAESGRPKAGAPRQPPRKKAQRPSSRT